jgi:hypothetical protein
MFILEWDLSYAEQMPLQAVTLTSSASGSPLVQVAAARRLDVLESEMDAQVRQLYGPLLQGPRGGRQAAEAARLAVSSPEGTKALSEAIRSLLERHVEFIHQAHHHLMPVCTNA